MKRILVRTASAKDWDAIVAIEALSFREQSWGAKSLRDGLSAPLVSALVAATSAGGPAEGFVLWRTLGDEAEILSIGVVPAARRRGVAEAMMAAALEDARSEGLRAMFLDVDSANEAARALYRKLDFYEVGRRRRYYRNGHDALILRKDL